MEPPEHHKIYSASYVIFRKGDSVLLGRRQNTFYMCGKYGIPAGHIEENESATQAAIREAREEVGVHIDPKDLHVTHIMKRVSGDREYVDFFFVAEKWEGEPVICEPDKCDDLQWFPISDLPDIISYERLVVERYLSNGQFFSEYGYEPS